MQAHHKLTRMRGRYLDTQHERKQSPAVYPLNDEATDVRWQWLFRHGASLPFVHAVYGSSVYTFPEANKIFSLYVTASGFILEEDSSGDMSSLR